jgi:protocatechuate 3,4-dioxygenase beta subunit
VRGGVITGRITDAEDRPVIGERVDVVPQNNQSAGRRASIFEGEGNRTDDRGVYRVYGLAPGSYKVSVGQAASGADSVNIFGMGGSRYVKSFYPGVREEPKATIIEINEGSEITDVDIALGSAAPGFSLSGRVIDAESEQPVSNAFIVYSSIDEANQQLGGMNFTDSETDASGRFRLEGVKPGRYAVFTLGVGQDNTSYSDPVLFEISEGDVTGIEIKVRRGATISGVAVIENNFDPAAAASLQTVSLSAFVRPKGIVTPSVSSAKIKPDGSFHFAGLGPGKVQIAIRSFPVPPKGLTLVRTEVNGVDQPDGIELTPGARITGARLVFAYGTGAVRGEVKIEGGVLPAGTTLRLLLRSGAGDTRRFSRPVGIDARGRFVAENIPPGTYELVLRPAAADGGAVQAFEPVTQAVTVANATEVQATLVVNLAAGKAGPE